MEDRITATLGTNFSDIAPHSWCKAPHSWCKATHLWGAHVRQGIEALSLKTTSVDLPRYAFAPRARDSLQPVTVLDGYMWTRVSAERR
jgi:hypothetical protein